MSHHQLKYQCLYCNTHFIVLTDEIKPYHADGTYCPDCGATGTCLRHDSEVEGSIEEVIPGNTPLSHVGTHIEEQYVDGELDAYVLKEEIRQLITNESLLSGLLTLLPPGMRSLAETIKHGEI